MKFWFRKAAKAYGKSHFITEEDASPVYEGSFEECHAWLSLNVRATDLVFTFSEYHKKDVDISWKYVPQHLNS
jgi:hypothetical protein